MKPSQIAAGVCGLLLVCHCAAQPTLGIPEPGLLLFGSVTNVAVGLPLPNTAVTWQDLGGTQAESVSVPATPVAMNGQFFQVDRVPFETRSAGSANCAPLNRESASPNPLIVAL